MIQYSTHLKLLTKYLLLCDNYSTVVETGCGYFSSAVISAIAEYKDMEYYIYYSNIEYKQQIEKFVKNAIFIQISDWSNWKPDVEANLYFHDNEELIIHRFQQIKKIIPKTKYLILHDYDTYLKRGCDINYYSKNIIEIINDLKPSTAALRGDL